MSDMDLDSASNSHTSSHSYGKPPSDERDFDKVASQLGSEASRKAVNANAGKTNAVTTVNTARKIIVNNVFHF